MGAQGTVRVLIVDDDPVFRRILLKTFERIAGAQVAGAVATLKDAQTAIDAGLADLVTLDVVLQGGSGLDLLPWLRQHHPKVVTVLLTAGTEKRASQTVDALLLGAASLVLKPSGHKAPEQLQQALQRVVEGLLPPVKSGPMFRETFVAAAPRAVIAVGASTGGPAQLLQFLKDVPQQPAVPIVVTQHMASEHVESLANMLSYVGGRSVHLARNTVPLLPGRVYLACDNKHLQVVKQNDRLIVTQSTGPEENFCKPAVDPMFRSVASACGAQAVGVVMTGMGADGAKGAQALRQVNAPVVVQDQATSVVWGMPGAVVMANAATSMVPGPQLGKTVARLIDGHAGDQR